MRFIRLVFLSVGLSGFASAAECFVKGVAEDVEHNVVSNAIVFTHIPPTGWEDLIVTYNADERGNFVVDYPCNSSDATLYIKPPLNYQENFVLVDPPFSVDRRRLPLLAGVKLPRIRKGTFDVGRVAIARYFKVRVRFENEKGENLLPKKFGWEFWMRVRPEAGAYLEFRSMSELEWKNATKSSESELEMIVPEGRWFIDLSLNEDKGPLLKHSQPIQVSASSSSTTSFVLVMRQGK